MPFGQRAKSPGYSVPPQASVPSPRALLLFHWKKTRTYSTSKQLVHTPNYAAAAAIYQGYTHQPRGLYAQMVLGESFEGLKPASSLAATVPTLPTGKTVSLAPLSGTGLLLRHCSFQVFVADCPCDKDMDFTVVKAINGKAGSISFQSTNFPSKYLSAVGCKDEPTRVMLATPAAGDKDAASFSVEPGLSDKTKYSFKTDESEPSAVAGAYLTATTKATGSCAGGPNHGDVIVTKSPADKAAATWETHSHPPPPPRPPPPPPPKSPWAHYASPGVVGSAEIVSTQPFHGKDSLSMTMTSGAGIVGMSNRGLGHEGLVFGAGKQYTGYFFAKASKAVTFSVALVDYMHGNKTLASQAVHFPGGNWTMLNFSLTASGGTGCVGLNASTEEVDCGRMGPHSHICVQCGGEFVRPTLFLVAMPVYIILYIHQPSSQHH
jgi:hypothetical protein